MSEYLQRKARALELQREKDEQVKREQAAKAEKDKQKVREEEEKRKQRDAAAKEARRLELIRANEALTRDKASSSNGLKEWDPFAEDERPIAPKASTPAVVKAKTNSSPVHRSIPGPSKPKQESSKPAGSKAPVVKRNKSPEPLGRKERAAKALADAAKKSKKQGSIFSVRSLVEGRDGPSQATAFPPPHRRANGNGLNGKRDEAAHPQNSNGGSGSVKDRLNAGVKGESMRKLCPDRDTRDRRTIDEIHNDIKSRKSGPSDAIPQRTKPPRPSVPTTARPSRRDRDSSSSSSSESEDDRRDRKKFRGGSPTYNHGSISSQIQAMFRRPGAAARTYEDDYSDGSSDMEAGLSDIEQEDSRATRIARLEDQEADRIERERKAAKEKAKRERAKVG